MVLMFYGGNMPMHASYFSLSNRNLGGNITSCALFMEEIVSVVSLWSFVLSPHHQFRSDWNISTEEQLKLFMTVWEEHNKVLAPPGRPNSPFEVLPASFSDATYWLQLKHIPGSVSGQIQKGSILLPCDCQDLHMVASIMSSAASLSTRRQEAVTDVVRPPQSDSFLLGGWNQSLWGRVDGKVHTSD